MSMENILRQRISDVLSSMALSVTLESIVIEKTKDAAHGDFATTIAMQMARQLKKNPFTIAEEIVAKINRDGIEKIEIAKPGFINFFLKAETISSIIKTIIEQDKHYGQSTEGNGHKVNVEFVSANPTGALHLGHARGAALGDSICRLYEKAGFDVTREFYVNDAGNQIDNLALSIYARMKEANGEEVVFPEDGYHARDIIVMAKKHKKEFLDKDGHMLPFEKISAKLKKLGIKEELATIRKDLKDFRVIFDKFSFETKIRSDHGAEKVLSGLASHIYQEDGATLLKTSAFGDDKDRVIIKSDGNYTYFLPDIAYHLEKLSRGYDQLIDILGADHHGYINRMKAALTMAGYQPTILEVELIQMVRLIKDGQEMKMSKRSGVGVTLKELCHEVGVDATRYFFVARASSAHLDFDMNLATENSSANPVYYAQYAHARLSKLLRSASARHLSIDDSGASLKEPSELALLKHLADYPGEVLASALNRSPEKMTAYIQKLANLIHGFYTECRIIDAANVPMTSARLGLVKASRIVLKDALNLIGVTAPNKM